MKRLLAVIVLLLLVSGLIFSKDYAITSLDISAQVLSDGSVRMSEQRRFSFSGSYSWVEWNIRKKGFSELRDISAYIDGKQLVPSNSEDPGTFKVTSSRNSIAVRWFFHALDQEKTITIEYTLADALSADDAWSEFYWNFIGTGWERPTENISITVSFPEGLSSGNLYAWSYGRLEGEKLSSNQTSIRYSARSIDERKSLPLRIIFPSSLIPGIPAEDVNITPGAAQAEYEQWIETLNRREAVRKRLEPIFTAAGMLIFIASVLLTLFIVIKYGRNQQPLPGTRNTIDHPPSNLPPALVSWLLYWKSVTAASLSASILDLCLKGFFRIRQDIQEKKGRFSKQQEIYYLEDTGTTPEGLTAWEMELYHYLSRRIEEGHGSFKELFPQKSWARKWYQQWSKKVVEDAESREWHVSQPRITALLAVSQAAVLMLSVPTFLFAPSPLFGILLLVSSIAGLVSCFGLSPRNAEGQSTYLEWKAYGDSLKKGTASGDDTYKGSHIVYAAALQVARKKLDALTKQIRIDESHVPWIIFYPGFFSSSSFSSALTSVTAAAGASVSSVAGSSGASAGSAGGGTGGGAG